MYILRSGMYCIVGVFAYSFTPLSSEEFPNLSPVLAVPVLTWWQKVDQPTHPVIFTKRATSIIPHGESIFPHPGFTETVDYEGEIGVIIGKGGSKISEADAMNHVWGYTIINDVTARERQRDHKQFYIGKSPDTFCPMVSAHSQFRSRLSDYGSGSNSSTSF